MPLALARQISSFCRMLMRFDLESGAEAGADINDAGVFARSLHDQLAARGQTLQVDLARFVGAVFAPHHAEDAQFGNVRIAAEDLLNARVLVARHAVLGGDFRSDSNLCTSGSHASFADP